MSKLPGKSASKAKTAYVCGECGGEHNKWQGQCDECGGVEFVVGDRARSAAMPSAARRSSWAGKIDAPQSLR
jgi:DNA repair protein RadA/Sms